MFCRFAISGNVRSNHGFYLQLKGFPLHSPFIGKCRVATTIQQQMVGTIGTIYMHCLVTASRDLHIQIL